MSPAAETIRQTSPPRAPHPLLWRLGVEPRSLFVHEGRLERLTAARHGLWNGRCWIALRTSAIARPFWGLRRRVVERFATSGLWAVLLLDGPESGWLVPGEVAEGLIRARRWHLARDDEYKILPPLPEACRFQDATGAQVRLEAMLPGQSGNVPYSSPVT